MRVRLDLATPRGGLSLPIHYNYLINSAIYRTISSDYATFLHDGGFKLGKRSFKLFTFSRILAPFVLKGYRITFRGRATLFISSPLLRFLKELVSGFLRRGYLNLNGSRVRISGFEFLESPFISESVIIRTLSPITVYSTLRGEGGRKKTYYYNPKEREFSELASENARKKYFLLSGRKVSGNLKIEPLRVRENVLLYKGTVVKGWTGTFLLEGPKPLIQTVYDAGLGSKNPQGFGMFEVIS